MINYIAHRINTIDELRKVPHHYGVEIDLRDLNDRIILHHDPFSDGEDFEEYLKHYKHGTLILNVKSERIEHRILELIQKYRIKDYFFLDSTFPMMVLLAKTGEDRIAVRYSEYEGLDTVMSLKGKVKWVWIDCFTKLPIDSQSYQLLKEHGFNLCLVSPELQGRPQEITLYKEYLEEQQIHVDAICTKLHNIDVWETMSQTEDNHE